MGNSCYQEKDKKRVNNILIVSERDPSHKITNKKKIKKTKSKIRDNNEEEEIQSKKNDSREDEFQTGKKSGEIIDNEIPIYPTFDEKKPYTPVYSPYNPSEGKIPIIYDKIFLDGNSDNYDMILNFESFEQLKTYGWTANFSIDGWKKYQESIQSENIIIGVVGIKNRGKSFWLKRIMQNDNYKPNDGFLVNTFGISCWFPVLKKEENYQAFITIDSEGKDNPLLQNLFVEESDIG